MKILSLYFHKFPLNSQSVEMYLSSNKILEWSHFNYHSFLLGKHNVPQIASTFFVAIVKTNIS